MKKKDFRQNKGSSKVMYKKMSQNFVKSPLKFCRISQILVQSLWHVWRSGVRSAMRAASQLSGRGPTDVDVASVPAC